MERQQAETAVTLSALVVTGMFAYRKVVEPAVPQGKPSKTFVQDYAAVFGAGPPLAWGQFLKAAGALYIVTAIISAASPEIGGAIAVLVATSAVIGNGVALSRDLHATNLEHETDLESLNAFSKPGGLSTLPKSGVKPGQPLPSLGK